MTIGWIAYGLAVGAFLALTARCFDDICRLASWPTRWGWIGALVLTVALAGVAPRRQPVLVGSPSADVSATRVVLPAKLDRAPTTAEAWLGRLERARAAAVAMAQTALGIVEKYTPPAFGRYFTAAWAGLSALLLLAFAATYGRFHRLRRQWPAIELQGTTVRVTPDGGPAVVGLAHPEIIVPRWLLDRAPDEQRLVLAHEREHVRAHDPLLIVLGCVAAALLPWHPAVWWMLSRLRLAVELDCDRRVLAKGVRPKTYGMLLIDLAGRSSSLAAGVGTAALADKSSHLQQRLLAMKPIYARFAVVRGGVLSAFATLSLAAAWTIRVPTVAAQDADSATAKAKLQLPDGGTYVSVSEGTVEGEATLSVDTTHPASGEPSEPSRLRLRGAKSPRPNNDPIVIVDGIRLYRNPSLGEAGSALSASVLHAMDPSSIESIEVLKGSLAAALYGQDAADGVIVIKTTRASKRQP